jgi:putative colanic acid biosynthesis acetyltransferase WcaB
MFRFAQLCDRLPGPIRWLGWPHLAAYTLIVIWELGIELNYRAQIGPGLRLFHGTALVVHDKTRMGAHCTLRHCTTIGMRNSEDDVPVIGNHVDIGSNTVLIGNIQIGDHARIGAGSVVVNDVPAGASVAGNPARPLNT